MKTVMTHNFSNIPKAEIQRSSFDRSHGYKTTFNAGYLVPCYVDEALPGDTFNLRLTAFARLATPIKPLMDNMFMDFFFFAIPIRIIWNNWVRMMGEQTDGPTDSTDYEVPYTTTPADTGVVEGSLGDYLGLPLGLKAARVSALFQRAYDLTWNDWFRSENLQNALSVPKTDGPDGWRDSLMRRTKRQDYFTSCLPWPQKGEDVLLPLGTTAPVVTANSQPWKVRDTSGGQMGAGDVVVDGSGYLAQSVLGNMNLDPNGSLEVSLASATSAKINQLREAFQLQRMFERDARGGSRYIEIIRSHFNVISPDFRHQRPELLGLGSVPIQISQIPQSSASGTYAETPQGNLAAYGTATAHGIGFTKSFTEHCILLGLVNVRADLTYQQGVNRMWSRKTRFDFYWPALAHLGEQAVLNRELYAQGTSDDDLTFGYNERFSEYRYKPSVITGALRSTAANPLDVWHLSQEFATLPTLSSQFIEDNPPIDRVVAVPGEPHFIYDSFIKLTCARPMPVFGVPGYIDHF